ncbi:Peptidase propeptide and YPEB domain-containing protein [Rhodovulum sp. ES.010]|uniref:PepSY domain-containing protein n=1 Tax=Rhodovulum sp. ES.010 TaxID=1882821 RepID=UPI00092684EC|nr:PepSY domain-containing protein [Rhodovulum sp. ES.010]SIO47704.1 Peptidase propeptide and YPEB domain-containing protein [Rhodovulum sp. ES.010]SIO53209.1 Peptidase propeptide and YPEB domain-containing protein [Rhodovulum sp. ES.010]
MKRFALLASILVLAAPAPAERDHDRARRALERGEIRPLHRILPEVEDRFDARLLEVELEREEGRLVYEMELITRDGRLLEVLVDAASGQVLEHEIEDDD